jgi:acyl carrier protein
MTENPVETTAEDLSLWLARQVAAHLRRDPAEIDQDTLFADYGLDSVHALTFCADIEDRWDITVADTVLWDHSTIRELVEHLMELLAEAGSRGPVA